MSLCELFCKLFRPGGGKVCKKLTKAHKGAQKLTKARQSSPKRAKAHTRWPALANFGALWRAFVSFLQNFPPAGHRRATRRPGRAGPSTFSGTKWKSGSLHLRARELLRFSFTTRVPGKNTKAMESLRISENRKFRVKCPNKTRAGCPGIRDFPEIQEK